MHDNNRGYDQGYNNGYNVSDVNVNRTNVNERTVNRTNVDESRVTSSKTSIAAAGKRSVTSKSSRDSGKQVQQDQQGQGSTNTH